MAPTVDLPPFFYNPFYHFQIKMFSEKFFKKKLGEGWENFDEKKKIKENILIKNFKKQLLHRKPRVRIKTNLENFSIKCQKFLLHKIF